jgi:glyoxylase-like metal-dependent hydrolase (beta-lactamase superfamily II)
MVLALLSLLAAADSTCGAARCKCRPATDSAHAAWADVVFTGDVLLVLEQPDADRALVMLRVLSRSKGRTADTVRVVTGLGGGDCGVPFAPGRSWRVYAQERQGEWWTNVCVGTQALEPPPAGGHDDPG